MFQSLLVWIMVSKVFNLNELDFLFFVSILIGLDYGLKDYSSVGLFASKTFFEKLGVTLQMKGENVAQAKNIDMDLYGIDVTSTASRKIFFVPQLSFSHNSFTIYALSEIPIYQYLQGTQIGSKYQITTGISYRFFTYKTASE